MARSSSGMEAASTMVSSSSPSLSSPTRPQDDNEIDPRCRIVVVSSSRATAKAFVERVVSMSNNGHDKTTTSDTSNRTTESGSVHEAASTPRDKEDEETTKADDAVVVIPHTLRNRYYEADVWFWVVGVEKLKSELAISGSGGKDEEDDGGFGKFDAGDGAFDNDEEEEDEDEEQLQNIEKRSNKMTQAPAIVYVWDDVLEMERCQREIGELVRGMKKSGWHGDDGAEVCLAVRMGGGARAEEEDGDVDGMFMDHGFEYIDGREEDDSKEVDEDVPRLPRVLDALSTIMWTTMRSKAKGAGTESRRGKQVTGKDKQEEDEEREGLMSELLDVVVRRSGEDDEEEVEFGEMMSSPVDIDMLSPFGFGQEGGAGAGVRRKVSMGFEDDFVEFGGYVALEEEEGLPTKEEIEQTASRIMGGSGGEMDLSSVFLSLEGLKSEIAGLSDEEEKRRMAARVALGLAYAFDLE